MLWKSVWNELFLIILYNFPTQIYFSWCSFGFGYCRNATHLLNCMCLMSKLRNSVVNCSESWQIRRIRISSFSSRTGSGKHSKQQTGRGRKETVGFKVKKPLSVGPGKTHAAAEERRTTELLRHSAAALRISHSPRGVRIRPKSAVDLFFGRTTFIYHFLFVCWRLLFPCALCQLVL